MKKNATLVQALCEPYCIFYKQGKNEELLCRGAVIVEQLLGTHIYVPGAEKAGPRDAGWPAQEQVIRHVCSVCDFREADCDFAQDRNARPCGGFVLLARLLGADMIRTGDLT
jgi:hypothetical protein